MKNFVSISKTKGKSGTSSIKEVNVYQIKKNSLHFLFDFEINTASFKGYESSVMNQLASRGFLPEHCNGYYLQTSGDFRIENIAI